jgi:hypothetical protein
MIRRYASLSIVLVLGSGCADFSASPIFHPGPAWYQQAQAQRFDPYPMVDVAPEVVGGRPLAYIRPAPQTELVQDSISFQERYGQPPPPGIYKPPRGTVAQQQIQYVTPGLPPPGQAPLFQPSTMPGMPMPGAPIQGLPAPPQPITSAPTPAPATGAP